mmetsp:Transcript_27994/g.70379  ORF Transcript_27994/g.70379 Transcript_27994/m.70379 type:complete len:254 (-) Transcript_27994:1789-2550(-)
MTTVPACESILALRRALRMRLAIHSSAARRSMLSFSDSIFRSIVWWMRQNSWKMNSRAFSTNSSLQAARKKSVSSSFSHSLRLCCAPSKSYFTNKLDRKSVTGSVYSYASCWMTCARAGWRGQSAKTAPAELLQPRAASCASRPLPPTHRHTQTRTHTQTRARTHTHTHTHDIYTSSHRIAKARLAPSSGYPQSLSTSTFAQTSDAILDRSHHVSHPHVCEEHVHGHINTVCVTRHTDAQTGAHQPVSARSAR